MKIMYTQNKDLALTMKIDAAIEMEYGDYCVEGEKVTLAHHGSRSKNPAPCVGDNLNLNIETVGISHADLDCIGGIMRVLDCKVGDNEVWNWAGYLDVKGIHHMMDVPKEYQTILGSLYYVCETHRLPRAIDEVMDVTTEILDIVTLIEKYFSDDKCREELDALSIRARKEKVEQIEKALVFENSSLRAFVTDGVFCSASYDSPNLKAVLPATVTLNLTTKAITIAFEDGGENHNAAKIAQELWGDQAGGREGIAGSPRGWDKDLSTLIKEFTRACLYVAEL